MPKNLFQDMVTIKHSSAKSIKKDTPKYSNMRETKRVEEIKRYPEVKKISNSKFTEPPLLVNRDFKEYSKKPSRHGLWLIAIISIIFFVFALSFLFARAQVTIFPRIENITLDENLYAVKDSNSEGISFDLVIISGEETKSILGSEQKEVSLNSKGSVLIYNTFSTTPQKLSINTRLEGSNGKIYTTANEIIVPGITPEGNPGSIKVDILGALAGNEYDSEPLDFKIAGFKGTSKYDKFYGRSVGGITGGFRGLSPNISDIDKENTFAELKTNLKEKLLQKATDQIPNGFILFKDATFLEVEKEEVDFAELRGDNSLPLKVSGTLYGFLFSEKKLTEKIAKGNIAQYNDAPVYIPNIKELKFSMSDQVGISSGQISFANTQNINFNLSGPATVIWKLEDIDFAGALLGKSKKDFNAVLSEFPDVSKADLAISPFWVRSIPEKSKDIKIIINYPN
jgi:hypothetical protein